LSLNERYKKQELFLGRSGQEKLLAAHVLVVGAGALGSSSAEMLARAGVGSLTIVDRDYVEWSNLQRQQLYTEEDAERKLPKAVAAKERLSKINSGIKIEAIVADVNGQNIEELVLGKSVIVDATDNFETRLIVNDAAVKLGIPFVFGACVGSYGLTFPIIPGVTPCLHCLMDHLPAQGMTCDTVGVISPIVGLVASHQVTRVFQLLTGYGVLPVLQSFDIWKSESSSVNIEKLKKKNCPTCGEDANYPYLSFDNATKTDVLCGRDAVQLRPSSSQVHSLESLAQSLVGVGSDIISNPFLLSFTFEGHRIVIFRDGRAIVHGTSDPVRARGVYNRIIS
jgi:sulfur carrier protein ThiS adenylyltransferase